MIGNEKGVQKPIKPLTLSAKTKIMSKDLERMEKELEVNKDAKLSETAEKYKNAPNRAARRKVAKKVKFTFTKN